MRSNIEAVVARRGREHRREVHRREVGKADSAAGK